MPQYPPQNPGSPFQSTRLPFQVPQGGFLDNSGEPGSYGATSAHFPRRPSQPPQMPSPAMLRGMSNAMGLPPQPPVTRPPLSPPAMQGPPQLPPVIQQMLQGANPTFSRNVQPVPPVPPVLPVTPPISPEQQTTNMVRQGQNTAAQSLRMEQGLRPLPPTPGLIPNPRR